MDRAKQLVLSILFLGSITSPTLAENVIVQPVEPQSSQETTYVWEGNRTDANAVQDTGVGLPQPVEANGARYITGGIGSEEREAIEAAKSQYNLQVTSTNMAGEFDGDTKVTILDQQGSPLVSTNIGPLFYAQLQPGTYSVEASSSGMVKRHKVTIRSGKTTSLYLRW